MSQIGKINNAVQIVTAPVEKIAEKNIEKVQVVAEKVVKSLDKTKVKPDLNPEAAEALRNQLVAMANLRHEKINMTNSHAAVNKYAQVQVDPPKHPIILTKPIDSNYDPSKHITNIINSPITINNYKVVQNNINIFIINVNKFGRRLGFKLPIDKLIRLNSMAQLLQNNFGCNMKSDLNTLDMLIKSQITSRMSPERYSRFINELR